VGPTQAMGPMKRSTRRRLTLVMALIGVVTLLIAWDLGPDSHATSSGSKSSPPSGATAIDPSAFSPGACVAFPPTSGDRHLTVFLDAGHGGIDPGAIGTTESGETIYEADETLPVELDTTAILRSQGFRVVDSRTGSTNVTALSAADVSDGVLSLQGLLNDVAARDICANDAHADILVGIYFDSGSTPQNAGSVTVYDADRPFSQDNIRLADLLQNDVLTLMNEQGWGIPNEGVQTDTNFGSYVGDPSAGGIASEEASYDHLLLIGPAMAGYFSTPSEMPGAVIEPLFITDPFEGSIAASSSGQQVIAQGIATAIEQYFAPPSATPNAKSSSHGKASRHKA
jgi:N-acetylmuramoyl-L-alanine amidase